MNPDIPSTIYLLQNDLKTNVVVCIYGSKSSIFSNSFKNPKMLRYFFVFAGDVTSYVII